MRFLLIAINLLLAVWLLVAVGGRFVGKSAETEYFSVKKRDPAKKAATSPGTTEKKAQPESIDSLLATIVDNNIFNPDRCPNAILGRGRSNRVELTLVGTFEIGESRGAIILQKTSSNNRSFQGGMRSGGFAGSQQQGSQPGRTGNDSTETQVGTLQQYVRVGESLSNGYTLAEVTRTSAVLTRGSDKMELELQEASKNQTKAAAPTNQRGNFWQQMQQMQQMQMMQNGQVMRMMRDTMRNQNQNQNQSSGNRGGNTSGNTGGGFGGGGPGGGMR